MLKFLFLFYIFVEIIVCLVVSLDCVATQGSILGLLSRVSVVVVFCVEGFMICINMLKFLFLFYISVKIIACLVISSDCVATQGSILGLLSRASVVVHPPPPKEGLPSLRSTLEITTIILPDVFETAPRTF